VAAIQHYPAMGSGVSTRHAAMMSCWLCGVRLHESQMVPDGSDSCDDVRWYCGDVQACTQRWTSQAEAARRDQASGTSEPGPEAIAG
jgi:hypothetical protein